MNIITEWIERIDWIIVLSVVLALAELRDMYSNYKGRKLQQNVVAAAIEYQQRVDEMPKLGKPKPETEKKRARQAMDNALKRLEAAKFKDWKYNGVPEVMLKIIYGNAGMLRLAAVWEENK